MPRKPRRARRGNYTPILVPVLDAFEMIGVKTTKGYDLINAGLIDTVVRGRRRFAIHKSLERYTAALPSAMTPTMAKAEHDRWSERGPEEAKRGANADFDADGDSTNADGPTAIPEISARTGGGAP
jgi:hypothetical protein